MCHNLEKSIAIYVRIQDRELNNNEWVIYFSLQNELKCVFSRRLARKELELIS